DWSTRSCGRGGSSMRSRPVVALAAFAALTLLPAASVRAAGPAAPPKRRALGPKEREAVLALLKAVDRAQETDVVSDAGIGWSHHVLKAGDQTAYVPFRVTIAGNNLKASAMYVRAVSRRDGVRASDERSTLRDWLLHGGDVLPPRTETVFVA